MTRRNDDLHADVFLIGLTVFCVWSILSFTALVGMSWYGSTLPPGPLGAEDRAKHEFIMQMMFPPPEDD